MPVKASGGASANRARPLRAARVRLGTLPAIRGKQCGGARGHVTDRVCVLHRSFLGQTRVARKDWASIVMHLLSAPSTSPTAIAMEHYY